MSSRDARPYVSTAAASFIFVNMKNPLNKSVSFSFLSLFLIILSGCFDNNIEKGRASLRLGDYEMAREFFDKELEKHPENYNARLGMGKALLQQAVDLNNDTTLWRKALTNLEAARSLQPGNRVLPLISECWETYARGLLAKGDTLDALKALSRSIEYTPQRTPPVNLAGIIYYNLGNREQALALFKRAIFLDSTSSSAHFNLGMLYFQEGRIGPARVELGKALEHDPDNEEILYWFALSEKKLREGTE